MSKVWMYLLSWTHQANTYLPVGPVDSLMTYPGRRAHLSLVNIGTPLNKHISDFIRSVAIDVPVSEVVVQMDGIGCLELFDPHMRNANKNSLVPHHF